MRGGKDRGKNGEETQEMLRVFLIKLITGNSSVCVVFYWTVWSKHDQEDTVVVVLSLQNFLVTAKV